MAAEQPQPSVLDEQLAEIDRRLEAIQAGLEPAPGPPAELVDKLHELIDVHQRLLNSTRELMVSYAGPVKRAPAMPEPGAPAELEGKNRSLPDMHQLGPTS